MKNGTNSAFRRIAGAFLAAVMMFSYCPSVFADTATPETDESGIVSEVSATTENKQTDDGNAADSDENDSETEQEAASSADVETEESTDEETPMLMSVAADADDSEETLQAAAGAVRIGDTYYDSLKAAVDAAVSGDTITLVSDISTLSALTGGKAETVSVSGKDITISGNGFAINRTADYLGTMFTVASGAKLTLDSVTVNGNTDWSWSYTLKNTAGYGNTNFTVTISDESCVEKSSLINNAGTLVLNGVNVKNLVSKCSGAAVTGTGSVTISGSSFEKVLAYGCTGGVLNVSGGNVNISSTTATDCGAGALNNWSNGGFANLSRVTLTVDNSTFKNVFATGNSGVMQFSNMTGVTVKGTTFDACVVGNDGGVTQVNNSDKSINPSDFTFSDCKFINMVGVAVYNQSLGYVMFVSQYPGYDKTPIVFNNCLFENSISCDAAVSDWGYREGTTYGCTINFNSCTFNNNKTGALFQQSSRVTMTDCTITNNTTYNGAVSNMIVDDNSTLTLKNTVVTGNTAANNGGAVRLYGTTAGKTISLTIDSDCTITGNTAGNYGGAIYSTGVDNVIRTITIEDGAKVYNNTAGKGGDDICIYAGANSKTTLCLPDAESMEGKALADGADINGWYYDVKDNRFVRYVSDEETDCVDNSYVISSTLYLKAEAGGYVIAFEGNADNASGTTSSMQMKFDDEKNLTSNGFTRSGYTFSGWNTKADGSGTSYTDKQAVENLAENNGETVTLYAQWKKVSVTPSTPTPSPDTGKVASPDTGDSSFSFASVSVICLTAVFAAAGFRKKFSR